MLPVIAGAHPFQSAAKTALMRRSISAGLTCWASVAGADRTRSPGRRLGPAVPGRPVHRASTGAGTSQAANRPDVLCLGCLQLGAHGPADPQACVRFAPVAARQPLANARLRADARGCNG